VSTDQHQTSSATTSQNRVDGSRKSPGSLLEVTELLAGYGDGVAVRDVSLSVNEGELVGLLGANGAGKSTTLNSIHGLVKPRGGSVRIANTDLTGATPRRIVRAGCALVPEGRGLIPQLTVEQHLRIGAYSRPRAEYDTTRAEVVELFPILHERSSQIAGTLSGGEQQMLALGRALMAKPKLLLVDELSLGLAPRVIHDIYTQLTRAVESENLGVLVVEQHSAAATEFCDRLYVLADQVIALEGLASEFREGKALHAAYLGRAAAGEPGDPISSE